MQELLGTSEVKCKKKWKCKSYIKELKGELKIVTWTSKEELIVCTKIVIGATFLFGIGVYVVDLALRGALNWINMIFHKIF